MGAVPRPANVDYLQPDEEVLHQTGRHPLSVVDEIIGATVLVALVVTGLLVWTVGFQPRFLMPVAVPIMAAVGTVYLIFLVTRYWRVKTSLYTITSDRTYRAHGRLRFFLAQTTYDKLTDMHVKQSLFGRIWGFGTVRLETAGTGISLDGVRDPFGYKQTIEQARSDFVQQLVGERPPPTTTDGEEEPAIVDEQEEVWVDGPTPASLVGGIVSVVVLVLFALGGTGVALFSRQEAFFLPVLFGVLAAFNALGIWVRYRFTRYHVGSRGVVVTSGWLTRRRVETTYQKVTDVTVYQGFLGRLFGFGNITINTAGSSSAPVVFAGVRAPDDVKGLIDETRRRWEARH